MPLSLAVLGAGLVASAALVIWGRLDPESAPTNPESEEDVVVEAIEERPKLLNFFLRVGRRLGGSVLILGAFVAVSVLGAVAGAMLDMVHSSSGFARWDEAVANWGAENATALTTGILGAITQLGSSLIAIPVVALVGYYGFQRWGDLTPLWFMATVYSGHWLVSNGLKVLIDRARPTVEHLVGTTSSSFPSTHAGTSAAIWAAAALVIGADRGTASRAALAGAAGMLAVSVAASRALLGVHWLTDVIAGLSVGLAWFLLVAVAFGGRALRLGEPVERVQSDAARNGVR